MRPLTCPSGIFPSMMKGGLAVCAHITAGQTRLAARRLARTNTLSSSRY